MLERFQKFVPKVHGFEFISRKYEKVEDTVLLTNSIYRKSMIMLFVKEIWINIFQTCSSHSFVILKADYIHISFSYKIGILNAMNNW